MATITLTKLHCERKQDFSGKDEPELYIAGQKVWNGKMGKGDTSLLHEFRRFDNNVLVELKEKNNKSKLLGSWNINDTVQANPKMLTATSSGYHYELWYVVSKENA